MMRNGIYNYMVVYYFYYYYFNIGSFTMSNEILKMDHIVGQMMKMHWKWILEQLNSQLLT